MKKIFFILCLFLGFLSCSDEKEKEIAPIGYTISVSDGSLLFLNTGDAVENKYSVKVESNAEWRLSGKKTWCKPSITEGEGGEIVTFEADPNPSTDSRSTMFTFICGDKVAQLVVTQAQEDVIDIYRDNFEIDRMGGEITVRVNSSNHLTYEIEENSKSWVTLLPKAEQGTRSMETSVLSFTINENDTYRNRTGYITLRSSDGISKNVTIHQGRRIDLKTDKPVYEIPVNGGIVKVRISTNLAYRLIVPESTKSWLTYTAPSEEMEEPADITTFEEELTIGVQGEMTRAGRIELQSLDGSLKTAIILKQKGTTPKMVEIPDNNFRKYLSDNYYVLDESEGPTCELTDLGANVTALDASGQKIHSLEGIKVFTKLTSLTCKTNYLKTLDLDGTNIATANLDENPLEVITCGSAPLSDINVSASSYSNTKGLVDPDGNKSQTFTVSGNNVTMVQSASNSNVGYFNIVRCPKCSYFTVSGCKAGIKIHINKNYTGYIPSWGLPTGAEVIRE